MGDGKHLRFSLASGGHRARAVWFGRSDPPVDPGNGFDVVGELSLNHWKGSVEPRFRVTGIRPREAGETVPLAGAGPEEWWERFDAALSGDRSSGPTASRPGPQESIHHRNSSEAVMSDVISSGESVAVVTAEAWRRWTGLGGTEIGRFGPDGQSEVAGAWSGSPCDALIELDAPVVLIDYETLAGWGGPERTFDNVVLFDPPASAAELDRARSLGGLLHLPDDPPARSFALAAAGERHDPVPALRAVFARLREGGPLKDEALRELLSGEEGAPRSPERAAILVAILEQAGIGQRGGTGPVREFGVVSSEEVDLERSEEFRRQAGIHREQIEFLRR